MKLSLLIGGCDLCGRLVMLMRMMDEQLKGYMSNGKVCICVTSGNRWNKHAAVGLCLTHIFLCSAAIAWGGM